MDETPDIAAANLVSHFIGLRELCPHYQGFKDDHDSVQCTHPRQSRMCNWCAMNRCPRLAEAAEQAGVA